MMRITASISKSLIFALLICANTSFADEENANSEESTATEEETIAVSDEGIPALQTPVIAGLQIFTGEVEITRQDKSYPATQPLKLGRDDTLNIKEGARAKILFRGGDFMHIPGPTQIKIQADTSPVVMLESGSLIAYAMPKLIGRGEAFKVTTELGSLSIASGKVRVVQDGFTEVMVFQNSAMWTDNDGEFNRKLFKKEVMQRDSDNQTFSQLRVAATTKLTFLASPEGPAAKNAIELYNDEGETDLLVNAFSRIQEAYRFNSKAAYYLGLIYLNMGDDVKAIRQWKHFNKIAPKEAKELQIPKHLTVLIARQVKDEITAALANEASISNNPPEPNSVAVAGFTNRGEDKYKIISKGLTALIISDLSKVPGLKVLERQKMQRLVDELKLAESGVVSKKTNVRMGKLMKAENIVIGEYQVGVPESIGEPTEAVKTEQ
ncbi:MAG: hypothetical protein HON94_09440 [Methylococcales bacterium]|jgi:TolB-like protein|nr:hypothetical protein [Methylococcales bacterium]